MSREKLAIENNIFPEAIEDLRSRLGKTQEEMAEVIGCKLRTYTQWTAGDRIPRGDWLLKILRMCHDAESFAAFGINIARLTEEADRNEEAERQGRRGAILEPMDIRTPRRRR